MTPSRKAQLRALVGGVLSELFDALDAAERERDEWKEAWFNQRDATGRAAHRYAEQSEARLARAKAAEDALAKIQAVR